MSTRNTSRLGRSVALLYWRRKALVKMAAVLSVSLGLAASAAQAQSGPWPNHPVKIVVPYPAGGNADAIGRWAAEKLSAAVGQSVIVENRAGAGAAIGAQLVARSAADGYTFLLAPNAVMVITPHLRKVPYNPDSDFAAVAALSSSYGLVGARKDLPANNMAELIALARQNPGKLSFGSAGAATATHLTGEIVHHQAGIKVLHVPYKGSSEALTDLLGGRIDLMYDPVVLSQVKAGKLKALAAISAVRHPELPELPTLKEQGVDIPVGSWFGLFAPKGTPEDVIARVSSEMKKALAEPAARDVLLRFSQYPDYSDPAAFARRIRSDSDTWKNLIAETGIKVE